MTKVTKRKTKNKNTKKSISIKNKNIVIINKTTRSRKKSQPVPAPRIPPTYIPFYHPPAPPSNIIIHHHNPVPQPLQNVPESARAPIPLIPEGIRPLSTEGVNPLANESARSLSSKTPMKTPLKVPSEDPNRFTLLSPLESEVSTPVIATPIVDGYPDIEVHKIFKKYKIPEVQEKEPTRETDWNIKTFIRHNVPFLFRMNYIDPGSDPKSLPSSEDIYRQLKDYVISNNLFEIPSQKTRGNKQKEFRSVFYKKLHNYIHKGTTASTMKSGIKQYLRNPDVY